MTMDPQNGQGEQDGQQTPVDQQPAQYIPTEGTSIGGSGNGAPPGFNQRIGQLTAQRSAAEEAARLATERLAAQQEQFNQLLAQNQAMMATLVQQRTPHTADPLAQAFQAFDPEDAARLQPIVQTLQAQQQAQFQALQRQMQAQQVMMQTQQATAGLPPAVAQRAQQLAAAWASDPRRQGWTVDDAIIYAQGEALRQQAQGQQRQVTQAQQFNQGYQPLPPSYTPPPMQSPQSPQTPALPANYDDLSPDQQLQLMEQRLNGRTF